MNLYFLYSIILIVLSLFFLLVSFLIFLWRRNLRVRELKFKKASNFLETIDFKTKIESTNNVSEFDGYFNPIINMSFEFQTEYKNKINILKNNLVYLNELNINFNLFESQKISKKINDDINEIFIALREHDEKIRLSKTLYESISNVLIQYTEILKDTMHFFETNLMRKYDTEFVDIKFKQLHDEIEELNNLKRDFDINIFFDTTNNINNIFSSLISLFKTSYKVDKIISFIESNINEIEKLIISGIKTIRQRDNIVVEKNLSALKIKYKNIKNELKFSSFDNVASDIKDCFEAIHNIDSKLKYTIKTNSFSSEHTNQILNWLSKIKNEEDNIYIVLNSIHKNFKDDDDIFSKIKYIYTLTNKLLDRYKRIKYNKNQNDYTAESYISFLNDTINLIYTWLISINYVIKSLEDKYSNFSYFVKEISNYKFSIAKIIGAIDEYDILAYSISNEVDCIYEFIEDLENKLSKNYKKSFNEKFYEMLIDKKVELIKAKSHVEKEIKLRFYAEKLLMYSNKFLIKNNSFINKIYTAEKFYLDKNYKKTILFLIKEIKKVN
ncbi:MAG: hypothetical protein ACRC8C_00340 [Mycoplasmoidaceae bacterium]